jgi:hypothetical protein
MNLETNEAIGSAFIEENEKERSLELFRVQEEEQLREEYNRKIMELTSDFKLKLRDLDSTYNDKKTGIDKERADIERILS